MGLVIFLILLGLFFLVVELIFLPGITLGTILSAVSYGAAIYLGFSRLGLIGGMIILFVIAALSLVALRLRRAQSLRCGRAHLFERRSRPRQAYAHGIPHGRA